MPIKACADRLKGEIEEYGLPPVFPDEEPAEQDQAEAAASDVKVTKKGKAAAKKGKGATQWDILKNSGIPEDEIHNFQYVLCYLPCPVPVFPHLPMANTLHGESLSVRSRVPCGKHLAFRPHTSSCGLSDQCRPS